VYAPGFFKQLNREFSFVLDAAATDKSAKCRRYFTPENDGLKNSWGGGTVFCNPPYGREIGKWVQKAYQEAKRHNITVVMLIPARTDTAYFHDYIYGKAEVRFIRGRLKFTDEEGNTKAAAPSPLCW
jgi:phage N-6-adenine-methyltransferase